MLGQGVLRGHHGDEEKERMPDTQGFFVATNLIPSPPGHQMSSWRPMSTYSFMELVSGPHSQEFHPQWDRMLKNSWAPGSSQDNSLHSV